MAGLCAAGEREGLGDQQEGEEEARWMLRAVSAMVLSHRQSTSTPWLGSLLPLLSRKRRETSAFAVPSVTPCKVSGQLPEGVNIVGLPSRHWEVGTSPITHSDSVAASNSSVQ